MILRNILIGQRLAHGVNAYWVSTPWHQNNQDEALR